MSMFTSFRIIRGIMSDNVHLDNQDDTTNYHRYGDDRKIDACEFGTLNVDVFPCKDVPP